jgi:hypothetical protein
LVIFRSLPPRKDRNTDELQQSSLPLEFLQFVEKVGQTIVFRGLLGWAFGPRNFMKNSGKPRRFPDVRGGLSTLSYLVGHSQVWL